MKTKIIPFDLETAKKIQAGEIEGIIKTRDSKDVDEIVFFNMSLMYNVCAIIDGEIHAFTKKGFERSWDESGKWHDDLVIEVPDNEPQFKPFDKVLVRIKPEYSDNNAESDYWCPAIFQNYSNTNAFKDMPYHAGGCYWNECIPYEGHENLIGTTDKPEEE